MILRSRFRPAAALCLLPLLWAACGGPTENEATEYRLAVQPNGIAHGPVGGLLPEPLEVRVTDAATGEPADGVQVKWEIVAGDGGIVSPRTTPTNAGGIARSDLRLGPVAGLYRVEATAAAMVGPPAIFEVQAVQPPSIASILPSSPAVGDTVTIDGANFATDPAANIVLFGGVRGLVLTATATRLRVEVPLCLPERSDAVAVTVGLGAALSNSVPVQVRGMDSPPIELAVGQALTLTDPAQLGCVTLPGGQPDAAYLLVVQNAADATGQRFSYALSALGGRSDATASAARGGLGDARELLRDGGFGPAASAWELALRRRERRLPTPAPGPALEPQGAPSAAAIEVGDRRAFQVINEENDFTRVTAEVVHISDHGIFYQDIRTPAGGFAAEDYGAFGEVFDDFIYDTEVGVFGAPSDVDGNGKVIILFTPVVNEMSGPSDGGFIAGFFYGLDLLPDQPNSNKAEIFYSVVPDTAGTFGRRQPKRNILSAVPPVLAHEFQHMIHFNQRRLLRGVADDAGLWLSEGLAHTAESIVGRALVEAGHTDRGTIFLAFNYARAFEYLQRADAISLLAEESLGSLGERGAAWLFMEYLGGHFGGNRVYRDLTHGTRSSTALVVDVTGRPWRTLFNDWSVAVWADDSPDLAGATVDARYTFPQLDIRDFLERRFGWDFPLLPQPLGFRDAAPFTGSLRSSAAMHFLVRAQSQSPPPVQLTLADRFGRRIGEDAGAQIAILRVN